LKIASGDAPAFTVDLELNAERIVFTDLGNMPPLTSVSMPGPRS